MTSSTEDRNVAESETTADPITPEELDAAPVCLLNDVSKIYERILERRLTEFLKNGGRLATGNTGSGEEVDRRCNHGTREDHQASEGGTRSGKRCGGKEHRKIERKIAAAQKIIANRTIRGYRTIGADAAMAMACRPPIPAAAVIRVPRDERKAHRRGKRSWRITERRQACGSAAGNPEERGQISHPDGHPRRNVYTVPGMIQVSRQGRDRGGFLEGRVQYQADEPHTPR
ncbi:UNVERIFIED_CONTAM: hypothetical protein PYX00_009502 [Menopon gallinae]|uniref:Uncharacterized protein n=1 Tax=Menopon gallinae TaxID=328185 RepID=A0AAW2HC71_9NEOP